MADINIGELVTVSMRKRAKGLADNVTSHSPLLKRLKSKGLVQSYDVEGGREIVIPLEYGESSFQRYRGFESISVQANDTIDAATYDPVQYAVAIAISGREMKMNTGRAAAIRLVSAKQRNAEKTMMNNVATDIMSTGALTNQIGGIQKLVALDPTTGTVGSIDRSVAANAFWRNNTKDVTVEFTLDATGTRRTLNVLWLACTRNSDQPDLVVADSKMYELFWSGLQANQRYADVQSAGAGFQALKFAGADVMYDASVPTGRMYMLNTDYMEFLTYPGANFQPSKRKETANQDAFVQHLLYMGNMTLSNSSLQGVLDDGV